MPKPEDCFVKQGCVISITKNFGMLDGRLKSPSVDRPVAELFIEAGYDEEFAYDPAVVLEDDIEHCYPEREEAMMANAEPCTRSCQGAWARIVESCQRVS